MQQLKNKHLNETCYIVGKGPSLQYISAKYFGEGPVITLNNAISSIEALNLPNKVYSMQKDGVGYGNPECRCKLGLSKVGDLDTCYMTYPKMATLLLHEHESKTCLWDYADRIIFDTSKLNLHWSTPSAIVAVSLAKYMGCNEIKMLCFDSVTSGNLENFILGHGITEHRAYSCQIENTKNCLIGINHEFITPE